MKQYQVPQFIMIEDKVIGPLTIKQTLYAGPALFCIVLAFLYFELALFIPIALVAGTLGASFAFLKIGEQPFPTIFKNALTYYLKPRLYVWRKEKPKPKTGTGGKATAPRELLVKTLPKLAESRLGDLAWSLDIKEKLRG